jgi:YVTN family beta-propeller protein
MNKLYVTNYGSNTISVVDLIENNRIKDMPVGDGPSDIGINPITNTIYATNTNSGTISIIDGRTRNVMAGVTFNVKPSDAGVIICDNMLITLVTQVYLYSNTSCIGKPNKGYEFYSWAEILENNTTITIISPSLPSPLESLLGISNVERNYGAMNITEFGSFTANFNKLPDPIPQEVIMNQYNTIAIGLFSGLIIPRLLPYMEKKVKCRIRDTTLK